MMESGRAASSPPLPDPVDARSFASAARPVRSPAAPGATLRVLVGWRSPGPVRCQWPLVPVPAALSDTALFADRWKCNRPTRQGEAYCEEHATAATRTVEGDK